MPQLAFTLEGPAEPWQAYGPRQARRVFGRAPVRVVWKTGTPDVISDHRAAVVLPGTGKQVDLTAGVPYVLLTYQGAGALYLVSGDLAADPSSVLPGGANWGELAWVDLAGIMDREQY